MGTGDAKTPPPPPRLVRRLSAEPKPIVHAPLPTAHRLRTRTAHTRGLRGEREGRGLVGKGVGGGKRGSHLCKNACTRAAETKRRGTLGRLAGHPVHPKDPRGSTTARPRQADAAGHPLTPVRASESAKQGRVPTGPPGGESATRGKHGDIANPHCMRRQTTPPQGLATRRPLFPTRSGVPPFPTRSGVPPFPSILTRPQGRCT